MQITRETKIHLILSILSGHRVDLLKFLEEGMTYRVSYIDTSSALTAEQRHTETIRTEDYTNEEEALARARELLESADCHRVLVSDGVREPIGGVCLQLKLGFTAE